MAAEATGGFGPSSRGARADVDRLGPGGHLFRVTAIDPDVAGQLAQDLPRDVFVTIVRTFEADLARLVHEMEEAARVGEVEAYRGAAHGLAGAAGSIGARRLEALARRAMRPDEPAPPRRMVLDVGEEARAALAGLAALVGADEGRPA